MYKLRVSVFGVFFLIALGSFGISLAAASQINAKQIVDAKNVLKIIESKLREPVEYRLNWEVTEERWDEDNQTWIWSSTENAKIRYFNGNWTKKGVLASSIGPDNRWYQLTLSELYSQENGTIELTRNSEEYPFPHDVDRIPPPKRIPISTERPPHRAVFSTSRRAKNVLFFITGQVGQGKSFSDVIGFASPKVSFPASNTVAVACDSKEGSFKYEFSLEPSLILRSVYFELGPESTWNDQHLKSLGVNKVVCDTKIVGDFEERVITRELINFLDSGKVFRTRTNYQITSLKSGKPTNFLEEAPPIPEGAAIANMRQPLIDFVWTNGGMSKLVGKTSTLVGKINVDAYRAEEETELPKTMVTTLVFSGIVFVISALLFVRKMK